MRWSYNFGSHPKQKIHPLKKKMIWPGRWNSVNPGPVSWLQQPFPRFSKLIDFILVSLEKRKFRVEKNIPLVPLKNHQTWLPHLRSAPLQVAPWRRTFKKSSHQTKQVEAKKLADFGGDKRGERFWRSWKAWKYRGIKSVPDLEKNRIWSIFESSSQGFFGGSMNFSSNYHTSRNSETLDIPISQQQSSTCQFHFKQIWSPKFLPLQKGQKGPSLPKSLLPDLFQIRSLTNAMKCWNGGYTTGRFTVAMYPICVFCIRSLKKVIWMFKNCHQCVRAQILYLSVRFNLFFAIHTHIHIIYSVYIHNYTYMYIYTNTISIL